MSNTSRILPGASQDNTGRQFAKDYQPIVSASVINIVTNQFETLVVPSNLSGAVTINIAIGNSSSGIPGLPNYVAATAPYIGDKVQFLLNSVAGATVTFGTGFSVSAATSVVGAGKFNSIDFIWNGSVFQERSRSTGI